MSMEIKISNPKRPLLWNRVGYSAFTLAGLLYFLLANNLSQTVVFLGLALVFDPFNPAQKWNDRPAYQKIWLLVHVCLELAAFVMMFVLKKY